ncbi:MAG TPA: DUF1127 domain-containing protein [Stellaceae bacterium]|nr:DUF1127 domain-containing protein [Stellaceae bacterium]
MFDTRTANRVSVGHVGPTSVSQWVVRMFDRLGEWADAHQQRHALALLDDELLRDIGIDRATAQTEIQKPFWRA